MYAFNEEELEMIDRRSTSLQVNVKDVFDKTTVMSTALINAHALNDDFQRDVKNFFGSFEGCLIRQGPVKALQRCTAKAESDYSAQPFPTTCCIIDLIRGSVTFDDLKTYIDALTDFVRTVYDGSESKKVFSVISGIMRCKNGFSKYNGDDAAAIPDRYCDIKLNIVCKNAAMKFAIVGMFVCQCVSVHVRV